MPRPRVAELMALVAITALFLGLGSGLLGFALEHEGSSGASAFYLLMGALPMAGILSVSLLLGRRHRESRPFLVGFVTFGAVVLTFYVAVVRLKPDGFLGDYLWLFLSHLPYPHSNPPWSLCLVLTASVVVLGLPQFGFALLGGCLFRRFRR